MGLIDKIKRVTAPDDYEPIEDPYFNGEGEGYENDAENTDNAAENVQTAPATVSFGGGMNLSGSSIELKVVKPDSYKNSTQIADHLLSGRTVVLNLESTNKETARRLIDFLTGVAYSIGGDIKKVSNNTYVITPKNVAVSGDQLHGKEGVADDATDAAPANDFYSDLA